MIGGEGSGPARARNIERDMEAIRLSRQDNPFLQVLASRESLADSIEESESDDAILMSQELTEKEPITLAQVHEHLVRSPPPASWPLNVTTFTFSKPYSEGLTPTDSTTPTQPDIRVPERHSSGPFSLLNPTPIRSLSEVRRLHKTDEDSVQLMSSEKT